MVSSYLKALYHAACYLMKKVKLSSHQLNCKKMAQFVIEDYIQALNMLNMSFTPTVGKDGHGVS